MVATVMYIMYKRLKIVFSLFKGPYQSTMW